MKPLEWIFLIVLYLFDVKPENRIATQYIGNTNKKIIESLSNKLKMEWLDSNNFNIYELIGFESVSSWIYCKTYSIQDFIYWWN